MKYIAVSLIWHDNINGLLVASMQMKTLQKIQKTGQQLALVEICTDQYGSASGQCIEKLEWIGPHGSGCDDKIGDLPNVQHHECEASGHEERACGDQTGIHCRSTC